MASDIAENKQAIKTYLQALSGHPKTPELVATYVSDPHLMEHIRQIEAAFPKYELLTEQMLGEGDFVIVRGTFRGVHRGEFAGIPPTGKAVSSGLIIVYRMQNGRIAEHWLQFDTFGLLQQLRGESSPAERSATR